MNKEELKLFLLSLWRDGLLQCDFESNEEFDLWFEIQIKNRLYSWELKNLNDRK